jgi:hypothetical protein
MARIVSIAGLLGSAKPSGGGRSGLREWRPNPRHEEEVFQRPWLEAPSPYDYRPMEPPPAESMERDEENPRVIIIDI